MARYVYSTIYNTIHLNQPQPTSVSSELACYGDEKKSSRFLLNITVSATNINTSLLAFGYE